MKPDRVARESPDRVECCPDCGQVLSQGSLHRAREVIDLPTPGHVVRHHLIYRTQCGLCGGDCVAQPELSDEVVGPHRVGRRVMSVVADLRTQCPVPFLNAREEASPDDPAVAPWRSEIRTLRDHARAYQEEQAALEAPIAMRALTDRPRVCVRSNGLR
ncbi:MAG TPA: hypothetical protein PLD23_08420 [Armatimonadota bacterium]|nr:hypothetical protein [Armatimonadota bacterium]